MKAKILDGKKVAEEILSEVRKGAKGKNLKLVVAQVGENLVSQTYIAEKKKIGRDIGVEVDVRVFPSSVGQQELQGEVERIGEDAGVAGIIVQLPLPKHMQVKEVLDAIPLQKDVDVLSSSAFDKFSHGTLPILPPTVAAVQALLSAYGIQVQDKKVVLVGAGRLVGLPLSIWLQNKEVSFEVADKDTKDIASLTRDADIVISGVGESGLITGDMIQVGAVVIDAGTSVEEGPSTPLGVKKTAGDVDFESVASRASYITPVPGGVGPVTVACLFSNLITLAKYRSENYNRSGAQHLNGKTGRTDGN